MDSTVVGGADIPFSTNGPSDGITHTAGTTTMTITEAGIYKIDYNVTTTDGVGAAVAIAVNGAIDASTSVPVLSGMGVVSGTALVSLSAGDIVTVRNNSATPLMTVESPAVGAQVNIEKMTTSAGSMSQLATIVDATVVGGADVPFSNNGPLNGVSHTTGTTTMTVGEAGIYKIDYNVATTAGVGGAMAIAVNGVVDPSTSLPVLKAAGEVAGSTLLTLAAGDVITVRNNSATAVTLPLAPAVGAQLSIEKMAISAGSMYQLATLVDATVVGGADIPFSNNGPLTGIVHTPGATVTEITESGVYKVDYHVTTTAGTGANLAVAVNGTVDNATNVAVLENTGIVSGTALLNLVAGDVITVRNNSSTALTMSLAPTIGAQLTVEKQK